MNQFQNLNPIKMIQQMMDQRLRVMRKLSVSNAEHLDIISVAALHLDDIIFVMTVVDRGSKVNTNALAYLVLLNANKKTLEGVCVTWQIRL